MKFQPQTVCTTPGIQDLMSKGLDVHRYLDRHFAKDWGDLCKSDKLTNDFALHKGLRILSEYKTELGSIWIITEADRVITTVLLPSEY